MSDPHRSWNSGHVRAWLSYLAQALIRNHAGDLAWWDIARYTTSPLWRRLLQAAPDLGPAGVRQLRNPDEPDLEDEIL
ncbi:hypothetical protein [Nonomuraea sp. KM90]|uniref:hypothetical protein n=1 Tax=Nonomuraea sp. KM90 TaxID=3457428 RepID=UPI003FCD55E1